MEKSLHMAPKASIAMTSVFRKCLDVIFVDVEDVMMSIQPVFDSREVVSFWVGGVAYHAGVLVFLDSDVAGVS